MPITQSPRSERGNKRGSGFIAEDRKCHSPGTTSNAAIPCRGVEPLSPLAPLCIEQLFKRLPSRLQHEQLHQQEIRVIPRALAGFSWTTPGLASQDDSADRLGSPLPQLSGYRIELEASSADVVVNHNLFPAYEIWAQQPKSIGVLNGRLPLLGNGSSRRLRSGSRFFECRIVSVVEWPPIQEILDLRGLQNSTCVIPIVA